MKALVYKGAGEKAIEDRPVPDVKDPGDAIVRISKTTICGTDLHILKGDVPTCSPGRILGHEGTGVVEKVGAGVATFRAGDHVLLASPHAGAANIAGGACTHTVQRAVGFLATRLMGHKLNTFASLMPIRASIGYRKGSMRKPS